MRDWDMVIQLTKNTIKVHYSEFLDRHTVAKTKRDCIFF